MAYFISHIVLLILAMQNVAGKTQFAITGAVLIHPAFAIAPAEDIGKINPDQLTNNTKLVLWGGTSGKYALDVMDYVIHPEYHDQVTYATIALLDLINWGESGMSDWKAPVLPICMPVKGFGVFDDLYAVKMTDASGNLEKEMLKMKYVDDQDCEEFYYKAQLTYGKMNPINPLCAVSKFATKPCVWDGGTALITRQSWGFWKLLGFAVRGPGCGAPTRFINIHDYLPWINDIISRIPYEDSQNTYKIGLRRLSPVKLTMYKASTKIINAIGQCDKKNRGGVLYKDDAEVMINKDFVQGFYFVSISQIAEFSCVTVDLDVAGRTNAAVWLEHYCHSAVMGLVPPQEPRPRAPLYGNRVEREKYTCFIYYKTSAFIEFRFYFSFSARLTVTVYGREEKVKFLPNPYKSSQHTTEWWPTPNRIRFWYFVPKNSFWYYL